MSVHVITWVFEYSEAQLGDRLVLLVLADHAKKDGTASWPSIATICHEARMSRAQVHRCLRRLAADDHIAATGRTRRGVIVYSVNMKGSHIETLTKRHPSQDETSGGLRMTPEPSLEPSSESSLRSDSATSRKRDVAFDALMEVTNAMPRSHGAVGSVVAELRAEHPDLDDQELADEIRSRAAAFKQQWPDHSCTPTALGTHWKRLAEWPMSGTVDTIADLQRRVRGDA